MFQVAARSFVAFVVQFIALSGVAGALTIAASQVGSAFGQAVLLTFGGAIFAAALAVFLIQLTVTTQR